MCAMKGTILEYIHTDIQTIRAQVLRMFKKLKLIELNQEFV
jgi:hypothetical protein